MKRCLMCLLLAGVVFSLAAQTNRPASVYFPPVTGTGADAGDNAFFYMQIYRELSALSHITMGMASSSEFSLICALAPVGLDERPPYNEHRFDLNLYDNKTGLILSEQRYRYSNLTNADVAVRSMLSNVLTQIQLQQPAQPVQQPTQPYQPPSQPYQPPAQPYQQPAQPVQPPAQPIQQPAQPVQEPAQPVEQPAQSVEQPAQPVQPEQPEQPVFQPATLEVEGDWRDKLLFFSAAAFWTPRLYVGKTQASNLVNFGAGAYMEYRFLESVSAETGFELASDSFLVQVSGAANTLEYYQNVMLEVPVLLKLVLKPGDIFLLEPYSGVYLNFPLLLYTKPPLLSWVVGYQHAVKTGPGALFFDFRFSVDLGQSSLEKRPNMDPPPPDYLRYRASFSVGYKYGFLSR